MWPKNAGELGEILGLNILDVKYLANSACEEYIFSSREGGIAMQTRFAMIAVRLSLALLLCPAAFNQTITASLQGRVADNSGAVLTRANVTATNTETGFSRSTTSDDLGQYKIASLPVGTYKVEVKAGTFQPQSRNVALTIGESATLDFSLVPGQVEQQITVTGEGAMIEPTRTSTDTVIEQPRSRTCR